MAKKSIIQKNLRRIKLRDQYKEKRKKLKSIINNKNIPISERFAAQNNGLTPSYETDASGCALHIL